MPESTVEELIESAIGILQEDRDVQWKLSIAMRDLAQAQLTIAADRRQRVAAKELEERLSR